MPARVRDNMQYLLEGLFPIDAPAEVKVRWNGKVQPESWPQLTEECRTKSLRQVAGEYGVSHEAVRRMVKAVG